MALPLSSLHRSIRVLRRERRKAVYGMGEVYEWRVSSALWAGSRLHAFFFRSVGVALQAVTFIRGLAEDRAKSEGCMQYLGTKVICAALRGRTRVCPLVVRAEFAAEFHRKFSGRKNESRRRDARSSPSATGTKTNCRVKSALLVFCCVAAVWTFLCPPAPAKEYLHVISNKRNHDTRRSVHLWV